MIKMKVDAREKLKKEIMDLQIPLFEKVELWLMLNGYKEAIEIVFPKNRSQLDEFVSRWELYSVFIESETGAIYLNKGRDNSKLYKSEMYCIAKRKENCNEVAGYYGDMNNIFNRDVTKRLGTIYGFPAGAVEEFSKTMENFPNDGVSSKSMMSNEEADALCVGEEWSPFLTYKTRVGHLEDFEVAKEWAWFTKSSFPELYYLFVDSA